MRMSSRALLSLCKVQHGERQARVMMSPSPVNKLGLTLWGPWRKGNGIEWECAVAMLQDNIHGRWEAIVMVGEGGGKLHKTFVRWRADDPGHWHIREIEAKSYSSGDIKARQQPHFHWWPKQKHKNNTRVISSCLFFHKMQNRNVKETKSNNSMSPSVIPDYIFFDRISLKASPSLCFWKGQSLLWIFIPF